MFVFNVSYAKAQVCGAVPAANSGTANTSSSAPVAPVVAAVQAPVTPAQPVCNGCSCGSYDSCGSYCGDCPPPPQETRYEREEQRQEQAPAPAPAPAEPAWQPQQESFYSYTPVNEPEPQWVCDCWCDGSCYNWGGGCFVAGTKVLISDGSQKNVENVSSSDLVMSFDYKGKNIPAKVSSLVTKASSNVYKITFENNKELLLTSNHPVYTPNGWKSIDPIAGAKDAPKEKVSQLTIVDKLFDIDGKTIQILEIQYIPATFVVYSPAGVNPYENFYANGFLVHNKAYYE